MADDPTNKPPEGETKPPEGGDPKEPEGRPRLTKEKVTEWVREAIGTMFGSGELTVEDSGEGGPKEPSPPASPPSSEQIEDDIEAKVRAVMGKLHDEHDHEEAHKRLAAMAEASPVQRSKAFRWFWGEG